jgi:hypothetical protein
VAQEIQSEIEERWQCLDPIFIMGRQRTGTSIMAKALQVAGFFGFPEGHLWFDLVESFARLRDPTYQENVRYDFFALGSGRNLVLEKRFALMMDQFHRDFLPPNLVRWVDKSPGTHSVRLAPMLAELFPRSQFIFMQRNPITTLHSTIHVVSMERNDPTVKRDLQVFCVTCRHWVRVMELWRQVRPLLPGRYIEVAQEHIAEMPDQVAERVAKFLGIPQFAEAIADVFKSRRENTIFPDRDVGDFIYPVDWTDEQEKMLTDICWDEMSIWGYPLDFQHPGGPDPAHAVIFESEPMDMDMATYYRWLDRQRDRELAQYKELLARIREGRVMRVLNKADKYLRRLGLR